MQLYEQYRPRKLDEVAGHEAVTSALKAMLARPGFDERGFWFQGPSGSGKSTLARIVASTLCSSDFDIEDVDGANCTIDRVRDLEHCWSLCSHGESGWRAVIVDEAHAMSKPAVQLWLTLLEKAPKRRLAVFTSTEVLTDIFGNFTSPFERRVHVFTLQADDQTRQAMAWRLSEIAAAEHISGWESVPDCRRLVERCNGNMGMAIQKMQTERPHSAAERPSVAEVPLPATRTAAIAAFAPPRQTIQTVAPTQAEGFAAILAAARAALDRAEGRTA